MRIYVDFDDCLSESARGFSDLAAELFGVHVPYEEMRFFNLQKAFSLTDEQYAELLAEGHDPDRLLSYEEALSRVITYPRHRWNAFDIPGVVAWGAASKSLAKTA